jgi:hypothetical protein
LNFILKEIKKYMFCFSFITTKPNKTFKHLKAIEKRAASDGGIEGKLNVGFLRTFDKTFQLFS